jgi:uncharacterized protein YndB with AHSA1/START domain
MPSESFTVTDLIPAGADRIYKAWLDSKEHAAMTGGSATSESHVGGKFSAWDGYIRGTNLELEPGRRIVQSWRSNDFPDGAPDSRVEVKLEAADGGTRVTLLHSNVPEGQSADYEKGWREHYFNPMRKYFSAPAPLPPPPVTSGPTPMPPAEEWEVAAAEETLVTPKVAAPKKKKPAAKKKASAKKKKAAVKAKAKKKAPAKKKKADKKKKKDAKKKKKGARR